MIVRIVLLLVMMVVVMIVMYLYISDLCWSSGCQVCASFWSSNPADPESRFEGKTCVELEFWSLTKAQIAQAIAKVGGGLSSDWGVF